MNIMKISFRLVVLLLISALPGRMFVLIQEFSDWKILNCR